MLALIFLWKYMEVRRAMEGIQRFEKLDLLVVSFREPSVWIALKSRKKRKADDSVAMQ